MKMDNLEKLWIEELKDLHDGEKQITVALPKMVDAAATPEQERLVYASTHTNE